MESDIRAFMKSLLSRGRGRPVAKRDPPPQRSFNGTPCIEWEGNIKNGYGVICINGKGYLAHRMTYELSKGKIPDGLVIDHLCFNPGCVNPDHLEAVTQGENSLRGRNSIAMANKIKTHCVNGHEFTPENTKHSTTHWRRRCITCSREWVRAGYGRARERSRMKAWENLEEVSSKLRARAFRPLSQRAIRSLNLRLERKAAGICCRCAAPAESGMSQCERHRIMSKESKRLARLRKAATSAGSRTAPTTQTTENGR